MGQGLDALDVGGGTVRVAVDAAVVVEATENLIAETIDGDPDAVIVLGAHLDSVAAGPGINDNGSGTALLLELARRFSTCTPTAKVRFAWWAAEEVGLVGSTYHVDNLPAADLDAVIGYFNYDMVASPNYARFVYDGDGSSTAAASDTETSSATTVPAAQTSSAR